MHQFTIEILFHIIGIGSASGILYKNNSILLISDNGSNLYEYNLDNSMLESSPLFSSELTENIPKTIKPDFEAMTEYGDTIYIVGSGSTPLRNSMVMVDSKTKTVSSTADLSHLYETMQSFGNIAPADFNIEGLVYDGTTWYFFQRGNGGSGKNAIFTVRGNIVEGDYSILFNEFRLPKIDGVEASFTDAVLVDDKIYFLATAENTKSAYDDGDVLGSFVGRLNPDKMKIEFSKKITSKHKLEGITLFSKDKDSISFLLCEDNDTDSLRSEIFKLTLRL